jgi:hypothetical protein
MWNASPDFRPKKFAPSQAKPLWVSRARSKMTTMAPFGVKTKKNIQANFWAFVECFWKLWFLVKLTNSALSSQAKPGFSRTQSHPFHHTNKVPVGDPSQESLDKLLRFLEIGWE